MNEEETKTAEAIEGDEKSLEWLDAGADQGLMVILHFQYISDVDSKK